MKASSNAPDPDPRIGEAALLQAETGKQWLGFAKDAFAVSTERQAELDAITKQVSDLQLGVMTEQRDIARADRQRYEEKFRPIEDQFVEEASNYGSAERQAAAAAEAKADVQTATEQARAAAERRASSMGINPASGRFAGMDRAAEMTTALASAGAQNTARQTVRDKGLALKADVVNMGRGLPTSAAAATQLGLGAGAGAIGAHQGANAQYIASTGIMGQGFGGQMQGYSGMGGLLNAQYGNQVAAWDAENRANAANAAGFGSFLGGVMGFAMKSDEKAKKDKEPIEEGKALEAVNAMPVEEWTYKEGVADEGRHVGPYAQDFQRETGRGDGKTIAFQDAIGITMKAVQDLDKKVDKIASAVGLGGASAKPPAERRKTQQPTQARAPAPKPQQRPVRDTSKQVGLGGRK